MKKSSVLSQNSKPQALNQSKHLDREWLETKYVTEGLSTYEIGRIVKRDPKNIYEKLKSFGIQTRSRAETLQKNAWWKDGRPSALIGFKHSQQTKDKIREAATGRTGLLGEANPMFGRVGSKSPSWKGGTTPERQKLYQTAEWKALVKYIYARDEYTCQRCKEGHNRTNKLHVHHISAWATNPQKRNDTLNLITVCNKCHQWIHSSANTKREFIA